MNVQMIAAVCSLALFNLVVLSPADAAQNRLKACADEWNAMKTANQTAGKTYRAFQKQCLARTAAVSPAAGQAEKPARAAKRGKQGGGRDAMLARQRACAAEWKADKAAGKVAAGTKWATYWSACNKCKLAEGT
jgi:hypothetical protein